MMSYDAIIRDKDAEIARLRAERDAARKSSAAMNDGWRKANFENYNLRAERDVAREALQKLLLAFEDRDGRFYRDGFVELDAVYEASAALYRLSSPGAQQRAGEDGE